MTRTVGDVCYEIHILALRAAKETVDCVDDDTDDIDILPLIEPTDIVCLSDCATMEDYVDGTGVVLNIEPIADILTLAIDRERTAVAYIIDEEGYQLLWELIWAVVVRTVGDDRREAVCIVESTDEMV